MKWKIKAMFQTTNQLTFGLSRGWYLFLKSHWWHHQPLPHCPTDPLTPLHLHFRHFIGRGHLLVRSLRFHGFAVTNIMGITVQTPSDPWPLSEKVQALQDTP